MLRVMGTNLIDLNFFKKILNIPFTIKGHGSNLTNVNF